MKVMKEIFINRSLRRTYLLMLLAYVFVFIATFLIASRYFVASESLSLSKAKHEIEDVLEQHTHMLHSLEAFLVSSDQVTDEEFQNFMVPFGIDDSLYDAIYIAPSGKIEHVYPLLANDTYQGLDIISIYNPTKIKNQFAQMEPGKLITVYHADNSVDLLVPVFKDDLFYAFVGITLKSSNIVNIFSQYEDEIFMPVITLQGEYIFGEPLKPSFILKGTSEQILDTDFYIQVSKIESVQLRQGLYMGLFIVGTTLFSIFSMSIVVKEHQRKESLIVKLNYQNDYDLATNIFNNRRLFSDLDLLIDNNREFYLAFGVFNNLKFIYNKFGKKIGEGITVKAINRIEKILLNKSTFYRYGGDEYVIVFRNTNKGEVINILRKIVKQFENEIVIEKARVKVSMSFGVTSYPGDGNTGEALINNAHITLSQTKGFMRGNFEFFKLATVSAEMFNQDFDDYISKLPIENFEVYLMPVVEISTNKIKGFECLSRVKDELGNNINIADVISSFERNGRIAELDEYVFTKLLAIKTLLNLKYKRDIFLSSNCSALSLNEQYVDNIIRLYREANLKYGTIVIELTESYKVEDHEYLVTLFKKLNKAGIQIAIDDFGTGYSSLNYISKFPIYAIKIDKQYVRDYKESEFNRTLMSTLVSIASAIKCTLIAEGVDEHETLGFLSDTGCRYYQGFLFSKGVPLVNAIELLDNELDKRKK